MLLLAVLLRPCLVCIRFVTFGALVFGLSAERKHVQDNNVIKMSSYLCFSGFSPSL